MHSSIGPTAPVQLLSAAHDASNSRGSAGRRMRRVPDLGVEPHGPICGRRALTGVRGISRPRTRGEGQELGWARTSRLGSVSTWPAWGRRLLRARMGPVPNQEGFGAPKGRRPEESSVAGGWGAAWTRRVGRVEHDDAPSKALGQPPRRNQVDPLRPFPRWKAEGSREQRPMPAGTMISHSGQLPTS
ncbi:hypothetical protein CDD83_5375 [Cordyceps sp. RAO-2017]|nr:hypothetical protein CDD83_5375 [Cordyceps sp. RAO-2017]